MAAVHITKTRKGRPPARTGTSRKSDLTTLKLTTLRLRITRSVVLTAAEALLNQNADCDVDIASTLRYVVAQSITDEIDRVEAFIAQRPS